MSAKGGADPEFAFKADTAAHQFGQLFDDSQTQAGSAMFAGQEVFKLLEFLENDFPAFRRYARPGVTDCELDFVV